MNTQFVSNSQAEDRTNAAAGRRQLRRRGRVVVATVAAALMVASCSVFTSGDDNAQDGQSASQDAPTAPSFAVDSPTALSDADPSGVAAAQHFFPADAGDNDPASEQLMVAGAEQADQYAAAQAAINAGAPMMIIPDGADGEEAKAKIKELAPKEVIAWGLDLSEDPALTDTDIEFQVGGAQEGGSAEDAEATEGDAANADAAPTSMAELAALEGPNDGQEGMPQVLVGPGTNVAQVATARAAGAPVQVLAAADPRATSESMAAIAEGNAVALGAGFGSQEEFDAQVKLAANGELPGGGGLVFPGRRMVALYGHPSGAALGVMGEQNPEEAVKLAQDYANQYQELTDYPVVPAFEIIATVASDA
ncbi:MAG: cell wall-binding repeat-containing protein, partial [Corynebacterium casei]